MKCERIGCVSYRYERYRERPRSGGVRSVLIFLTVVVWLVVLGCFALRWFVRPALTDYVNREVAVSINPQLPPNLDPNQALRESLEQIPVAGAIPPGRFEVTEAMANDYLTGYREQMGEIDNVHVRFVPGEVQANISVWGLTGTARTTPAVQNGRLVATNTRMNQPLDSVISLDPLMDALLGRINSEVAAQGRSITDVEIVDGLAIVHVE
jgi:hypothetical protein